MKHICHLALFFAVAGLLLLCPAPGALSGASSGGEETSAGDVQQEVEEAMRAIRSFSAEQRDDAVAQAKEALRKLDARIDRLENRMQEGWSDLDQAARRKTRESLQRLREQRNELAEWYGGMKHGSMDAWDRLKQGFLNSYEKLENAFKEARKELASGGMTEEKK
ncbi:MAG: hypothetical protein K9M82_05300 [Deltaproteobacteria bacterium]|nr:hypothetical protein [Deltaproteobacteria bacterium]